MFYSQSNAVNIMSAHHTHNYQFNQYNLRVSSECGVSNKMTIEEICHETQEREIDR